MTALTSMVPINARPCEGGVKGHASRFIKHWLTLVVREPRMRNDGQVDFIRSFIIAFIWDQE